eukprot:3381725-Prymnesium_polylepis.1
MAMLLPEMVAVPGIGPKAVVAVSVNVPSDRAHCDDNDGGDDGSGADGGGPLGGDGSGLEGDGGGGDGGLVGGCGSTAAAPPTEGKPAIVR